MEIHPITDTRFHEWANSRGVAVVYHHGSTASGHDTPASDVDVALLLESGDATDWDFIEIVRAEAATELGRVTGLPWQRFDVQILNHAPQAFQFRVVRARRPLWESERSKRITYERTLMCEYLDYRHYEAMHNAAMRRRIREGTYGRRSPVR